MLKRERKGNWTRLRRSSFFFLASISFGREGGGEYSYSRRFQLPPLRGFQAINRSSIRKRFRRSDGAPTNQARMSFHLRVENWKTNQGNRFCKRSR